jgi:MFS transporter, DHA2 family, multidrug resistance protein
MLKHPTLVLITLMLGTSMAAIDSSIVNVSLPVIRHQFNVNVDEIEWVITAYMISFTLFIPLITWMKNRVGYFYLYIGSVAVFTIGSVLCSLSHQLTLLVIARVIQAGGGGAITPTSLAILSESFPEEKRGSVIGWWGLGNVMGPAIGPTLGGVLTQYFGWESVFYVNIPIGIATIIMSYRYLSFLRDRSWTPTNFDFRGFAWLSLFIVTLQYTISTISKHGQIAATIGGCAATILFLRLFIRSARGNTQPLLDLTVFRSANFVYSAIIVIIRSIGLFGGMFFLPFLLQGLLGYTTIQSGLLLLPNALMMLVARPYAGRKADEGLIRNISIVGIVLLAASMYLFARIDVGTTVWLIILPMIIRGIGISFLVAPVSTALLNAVTRDQTTTATSLNSLLQQLGGSIGIAIFGVLHQVIYTHYLQKGYIQALAEHYALQDGFFVSAIVVGLALIPAIRLPQRHAVRVTEKTAS